MAYNLSQDEFNGILGRSAPQNPALKYKPNYRLKKQLNPDNNLALAHEIAGYLNSNLCKITRIL